MKWYMRDEYRWLVTCALCLLLGFGVGIKQSWEGSINKAAFDCVNYMAFQYKDEFFQCVRIAGDE